MDTIAEQIHALTQKLFKDGKLIQAHINAWPAKVRLTADDLGLTEEQVPKFATLGDKQLIAQERLQIFGTIESRARGVLTNKQSSIPFPIGAAHFIPTEKVPDVLAKLNVYREQFYNEVDKFVNSYAEITTSFLAENEAYREKLEKFYPPAETIRGKFHFSVSMFTISFPSKMDELTLQTLQAQEQAEQEIRIKQRADLENAYNENFQTLNTFLEDAVKHVRSNITDAFAAVAEKIRTGKVISTRNLTSLREVISSFQSVNFLNDTAVASQLELVGNLINSGRDFKDDATAKQELHAALGQVLEVTNNVSDVDTVTGEYIRHIEL